MSLAYRDGKFVEKKSIAVGLADFGFSRGITLFELARVYEGMPFRLGDHLERLAGGINTLGIACPMSMNEISNGTLRFMLGTAATMSRTSLRSARE